MNLSEKAACAAVSLPTERVVAASVYVDGRRVANIGVDEASSWRNRPGHVVWIGLHEPGMALLSMVQGQFGLHDLAIEDANHAHQRPKIEQYGDGLFIVTRTAQLNEGNIEFGETHLFRWRGLFSFGPSRCFDILCIRSPALRELSARASAWRGLHSLCDPGFYSRQLLAGPRVHSRGGGIYRGACPCERNDAGAD